MHIYTFHLPVSLIIQVGLFPAFLPLTCPSVAQANGDDFSIISRAVVLAVEEASLRSIEAAGGHWRLDLTSRKGHVTQEHPPRPPCLNIECEEAKK